VLDLSRERVLVTGGAGFIGRSVVAGFRAAGATVRVLDVSENDQDITDAGVRDKAVTPDLTGIVHLAAITSVLGSLEQPAKVHQVNVEATAGLVAPYAAESGYQANLERYGIGERDLGAHLLAGLRTLTFTDLRFRPDVQVSPEDIKSYYDKLARQPGTTAAPLPSFEASRDQIEKLLVDQGTLEALDKWLETARKAANIRYREKAFE